MMANTHICREKQAGIIINNVIFFNKQLQKFTENKYVETESVVWCHGGIKKPSPQKIEYLKEDKHKLLNYIG